MDDAAVVECHAFWVSCKDASGNSSGADNGWSTRQELLLKNQCLQVTCVKQYPSPA